MILSRNNGVAVMSVPFVAEVLILRKLKKLIKSKRNRWQIKINVLILFFYL
ncbi:MAG: hypothetical protein JWQ57_4705 [Mucilaginibacter sp.]|nr:hypothetical protein [Mucilaginibacter sp.]